jgi:hypothetical protein
MTCGSIPWSYIDRTLRAPRAIWISTTRPDGRPHCVPVWFIWDNMAMYFITDRAMQKAKNLAAHTGAGDDALILEGPVSIVTASAEQQRIDALYCEKYVEPLTGAQDTIFHDGADLYRLDVAHVMVWVYGATANRTDYRRDSVTGELVRTG